MIKTYDLTKKFKDTIAIKEINLYVPKGSVYGFLGQNGAGKTTTIKCLTGLISPTSGRGEIAGFDIINQKGKIRKISGVLPENFSFYPSISVEKALEYFARLFGVNKGMIKSRVNEILNATKLEKYSKTKVGNLSRGLNRRLGLAQALIADPPILILDEATSGLDPIARDEIHSLLKKMNREKGTTIFFSTHILEEVPKICDRIGILLQGNLCIQDELKQFISEAEKQKEEINQLLKRYMVGNFEAL